MTNFISVYITVASAPEAEAMARIIVEEKLAACVNMFPAVQSIYRWEGQVETSTETVLIAKTRNDLFELLSEKIKSFSSYTCPCIVAWPIVEGNEDYLQWIRKQTKG